MTTARADAVAGTPGTPGEPFADAEQAIRRRVAERAGEWFPDAGSDPAIRLRRLSARPRAVLYAVHIGENAGTPPVLAKVRRDWPAGVTAPASGARPRLTKEFLSAADQTLLEYRGLAAIHAAVGAGDPAFGAIRPLDLLASEHTLLMEYVDAGTVRDLLVRSSRLRPTRHRPSSPPVHDIWRNAGRWLRSFQRALPHDGLPERQSDRSDVVSQFQAYGDFLERTLGARAVGDVARRGAELAAEVLPPRLPVAVGHGDYAPRNVFLSGDGRLTVFDPMPRWLVPRFEDLCRFLVGARLHGLQLHTRGLSDGSRAADLRERRLIEGYLGAEAVVPSALRCYQLLLTLDKWSALVDAMPSGRLRRWSRPQSASMVLASGYLRGEARRLIDLSEDDLG